MPNIPSHATAKSCIVSNAPAAATTHIVLIEDEAAIRKFLRLGLEANGYQVHEAHTGFSYTAASQGPGNA